MPSEEIKYLTTSHINEAQSTSFDLRNILNVLFRHKMKIVVFFILVSVIGVIYSFHTAVVIYESEAKLLVKPGRETMSLLDNFDRRGGRDLGALQPELAIIKSRIVIGKTIDNIGLERFLNLGRKESSDVVDSAKVREGVIGFVQGNLNVSTGRNSGSIVRLTFRSQSAGFSQEVLDTLISAYIDRHIQVHQAKESADFLQKQSEKLLAVVIQKEEELRLFCEKHGIMSMDNQKNDFLGLISRLQEEVLGVEGEINYSQSIINSLEKNLSERQSTIEQSPVARSSDPVINIIRTHIMDLKFQESELTSKYPDDSRVLVDLREQIKFAESELEKGLKSLGSDIEVATGIDPNYQAMQRELESEKTKLYAQMSRKQFLKEKIEKEKVELANFTSNEAMFNKLQSKIDVAKQELQHYKNNLQRANIYTALDLHKVSNVRILQPPTRPMFPLKSDKKRNVGLSLLLGLAGGIGLAFFWEYRDDTLKTNVDVEKRLGLPVLTSVPVKKV